MPVCFVCKKEEGVRYTIKDYWSSPYTPKGMTHGDRVCFNCYHKVKGDVLKYKKQHKEESIEFEKQYKESEKQYKEEERKAIDTIRGNIRKWSVIIYKDEYCAIVEKVGTNNVQFLKAFSDLTKEGYRLMVQDEGTSIAFIGLQGGINSFYFFQKIKYVQ